MFAANKRYGDVIFTILVKGADINAKDNNGQLLIKYNFLILNTAQLVFVYSRKM